MVKYDKKKEEIIEAGIKAFAVYGYYKTTLEDIAKMLGMKKNSLYYYFKNKEDLFREILNYEVEPYRSIFVWLLHGRRLNEVLSLRWQDINFEARTYEIVSENNKIRKNKIYPLTDLQLQSLPEPHGKVGLVFKGAGRTGRIDRVSLRRRHWKRITDRARIMGMRLHDLRHLFGYLAVNVLGLPLEAVAEVLGHSSTQVTARYANVGIKTVQSATDKFFDLLEG
jgi:integrase